MNLEFLKTLIPLLIGAMVLAMSIRRLNRYRFRERYALMLILLGLPFFALALWPGAVQWTADRLQINYNTVSLLVVTVFLILVIFELLTIVSIQDRKINALAQMMGLMMEQHGYNDRDRKGDLHNNAK